MPKKHGRVSGFTLLELLITLVVLAIVVALAAPSFVDVLDRRRIVDATETMMKQVQQGRAVAIQTNRRISMVFGVDGDEWCFGLTDQEDCVCNDDELDESDTNACRIPLATSLGTPDTQTSLAASDYVLVRASSDQFRGVRLESVPTDPLRFEPLRGLLISGMGLGPVVFGSARGREAHVAVNLLGRAAACSPGRSVETMRACAEDEDDE